MLKSYLLIAARTLRREKGYAVLNVAGLALGLACCLLLFLYVRHEVSYDRFHPDADRIFRVLTTQPDPDGEMATNARAGLDLGPALEETFADVEHAVRVAPGSVVIESAGEAREEEVLFADASLFDVFAFPLVAGDAGALAEPGGAVLSVSAAERLLGDADAVGRTLAVEFAEETYTFTVGAVAHDPPDASSIPLGVVLPITAYPLTLPAMMRSFLLGRWENPNAATFVRLAGAGDAATVEAGLPEIVAAHFPSHDEGETTLSLEPLPEVHLNPDVRGGLVSPGNPLQAVALGGVALLVLLIACINFATLALGRSVRRAREVGIRKTLGAHRGQIRRQFWGEALLITAVAAGLALALATLFLPTFNRLTGVTLTLAPLAHPLAAPVVVALVVGVGLLAGFYPALVLSRMKPVAVLNGRFGLGGARFGRVLIVVQFALSIALVAVTVVVSAQVRYLGSKPLGLDPEGVVILQTGGSDAGRQIYPRLRAALDGHPTIRGLAGSMVVPFEARGWPAQLQLSDTASVDVLMNSVDAPFVETMGIEVVQGQDLADARPAGDRVPVLVNETLMQTLGWTDFRDKTLPLKASIVDVEAAEIVGVVRDFHVQPLHVPIDPVILVSEVDGGILAVSVRFDTGDVAGALGVIEAAWERAAPDVPFEPVFLDEVVAEGYEAERQWRALLGWATGFALALAGLGLFGVAALSAARRTKEVGIRRVLGATVGRVVALLVADLLVLVGIGFGIAVPLAWLVTTRWLDGFAYHIGLGPGLFLLAGGLALAVAVVAVGVQALRAATADPVRALRSE